MSRNLIRPSSSRRFVPVVSQMEARITPSVAYTLSSNSLVAFDTTNPAAALPPLAVTGLTAGQNLVAIDFRPQNGQLYGLAYDSTAMVLQLYAISQQSGVATAVGTTGTFVAADGTTAVPVTGTGFAMDFNPTVDRIRVVTTTGQNFRIDPNTGVFIDGNLGGAAGSVPGLNMDGAANGPATSIAETAYTNNNANTTITTQYTLSDVTDALYIQNPPNSGTQTLPIAITLNGAPLDFSSAVGFDIAEGVNAATSNTPVAAGSGFAVLTVAGVSALYSINLVTGAATSLGAVGGATAPRGLAIATSASPTGGLTRSISLSTNGTMLLRGSVDGTAPTGMATIAGITAGETLVGIDFRPSTGQLFGLGINATLDTGTVYRIDPQTGAATVIGTAGSVAFVTAAATPVDLPDPATTGYGFDFNPAVDRIRVVTGTGLNFRLNPITGGAVDGDAVTGGNNTDANINGGATGATASAYTNSFTQSGAAVTTLYTISSTNGTLYIQNPPNAGTLTAPVPITLGGAPLAFTGVNGFDIPANVRVTASNTAVASGFGYAGLTVAGVTSIYRIDLVTGAATLLSGVTGSSGLALASAPVGAPTFAVASSTVSAAGDTATVVINRIDGGVGAFTVTLTATGTAVAGTDYTAPPITVTFADGQTTATVTIAILANPANLGTKTIVLTLSAPTNSAVVGTISKQTITIAAPPRIVAASGNSVVVRNADGTTLRTITPYGANFNGKVVVAQGDVNGDGVVDVITGAGAGGGPHVKVFSGVDGSELYSFFAFNASFFGGVSVGSADLDADGFADIIVGAGPGGGPNVKVFSGKTGLEIDSFNAYDPNYRGGIVVSGYVDPSTGVVGIVTGTSVSNHVKVFGAGNVELASFFAFDPNYNGGVNVGSGVFNNQGEVIIGAATASSRVRAVTLTATAQTEVASFFAYDAGFFGGVRVSGTRAGKIVTGAGPGGGPHVKVFDSLTAATEQSFFAFAPTATTGVYVG